ncbi:MAG: hypothetical protein L0J08_06585, partial [Micrococcaceae bacterium]|nr:hypothetical protein [Micrococcaceae bacterium]
MRSDAEITGALAGWVGEQRWCPAPRGTFTLSVVGVQPVPQPDPDALMLSLLLAIHPSRISDEETGQPGDKSSTHNVSVVQVPVVLRRSPAQEPPP